MADDQDTREQAPSEPTRTQPDENNDAKIPYDRFKEVNDAKKAAEQRAQEMEERLQAIERQQKEEKEEYKDLYQEAEAAKEEYKAKATELENYQAARRETLISNLPEDHREIAEGIHDLTKLEQYVRLNTQQKEPPPEKKTRGGRMANVIRDNNIESLSDATRARKEGRISEDEYLQIRDEVVQAHTH
jgi:hypothetical protein